MYLDIFRCGINEIKYIKDAISNVKSEEDACSFNEAAIKNFCSMMIIGFMLQPWMRRWLLMQLLMFKDALIPQRI